MVVVENTTPYSLIKEIEARSRTLAIGLPQQVEMRRAWSGIGYRLGEMLMVSALGEIGEILIYPTLTRLPHAKRWVKGLANNRGSLIPVLDLRGFVEGIATEVGKRSRVLLVEHANISVGLLVDEAMGLRHFYDEERVGGLSRLPKTYRDFVVGGYKQGNTQWAVFNMMRLIEHPKFMEVASRV